MKIGDIVYLIPRKFSNAHRSNKEPIEATITKLGNKFFYATRSYGTDFKIDKSTKVVYNGIYSPEFDAVFDLKEIQERQEIETMLDEIRNNVGNYGKSSLTNEQIRHIYLIIKQ